MGDSVHNPHDCGGKVRVYSSEFTSRLVHSVVHKERGTCEKCKAELVGFASYALDGVRVGVRYWFPERQPPPSDAANPAFDPLV